MQERHLLRVRPHSRADHGLRLQGSHTGTSPHRRWVAEAEPSWVCSGVWRAPGLRLTTWRGSEGSPDELLPAWGWGLPLSLLLSLPLFSAWGCCSWGVEPGSDRARSSQLTLVAVVPGSAAAPAAPCTPQPSGMEPCPRHQQVLLVCGAVRCPQGCKDVRLLSQFVAPACLAPVTPP